MQNALVTSVRINLRKKEDSQLWPEVFFVDMKSATNVFKPQVSTKFVRKAKKPRASKTLSGRDLLYDFCSP